jgi:hypothetical protein
MAGVGCCVHQSKVTASAYTLSSLFGWGVGSGVGVGQGGGVVHISYNCVFVGDAAYETLVWV